MKTILAGFTCVVCGCVLTTSALAAKPNAGSKHEKSPATEPSSQPAELPPAVQKLIDARFPGAKVTDVEEHVEDRRHLLFVDLQTGDKSFTLLASGRGQYLGIVHDDDKDDSEDTLIEFDTAPAPVKDAVTKSLGKPDTLFMEVENEHFIYCAEKTTDDRTRWLSFTLQGELMEEENEIALSDLPAAVKEAITKARPAGKLDSASLVKPAGEKAEPYYTVDVITPKAGKRTLTVSKEGQLKSDEAAGE